MKKDTLLFWKYVAPSITGMIIGGSFCIVDTAFIGRYGGKNAIASVALTWPAVMLLQAFGSLIGAGGAVLISQKHGAGEFEQEKTLFSQTLFLTLAASIFLFAVTFPFLENILSWLGATPGMMPISLRYAQVLTLGLILAIFMTVCLEVIRNDGHPTLSMILMIVGLGGNILLDWLCIFYFDLGTFGAALATVCSMGISSLLGVLYFISPLTRLKFSLQIFIPQWQQIKDISITGLPVFGNMLSIIAMLYMHNAQSLKYGRVDGLAAYTVISALEALGSMFMTGVAAIQKLILEKKPFFALDLHCPWIYGGETNETIYFPMPEDSYYGEETEKFSRILEKNSPPEAPHFTKNNVLFGTKWNTKENYSQGQNCPGWISKAVAPRFAATIEIPYAKAGEMALTAESVRTFGRALAESILAYDDLTAPSGS